MSNMTILATRCNRTGVVKGRGMDVLERIRSLRKTNNKTNTPVDL